MHSFWFGAAQLHGFGDVHFGEGVDGRGIGTFQIFVAVFGSESPCSRIQDLFGYRVHKGGCRQESGSAAVVGVRMGTDDFFHMGKAVDPQGPQHLLHVMVTAAVSGVKNHVAFWRAEEIDVSSSRELDGPEFAAFGKLDSLIIGGEVFP